MIYDINGYLNFVIYLTIRMMWSFKWVSCWKKKLTSYTDKCKMCFIKIYYLNNP